MPSLKQKGCSPGKITIMAISLTNSILICAVERTKYWKIDLRNMILAILLELYLLLHAFILVPMETRVRHEMTRFRYFVKDHPKIIPVDFFFKLDVTVSEEKPCEQL